MDKIFNPLSYTQFLSERGINCSQDRVIDRTALTKCNLYLFTTQGVHKIGVKFNNEVRSLKMLLEIDKLLNVLEL